MAESPELGADGEGESFSELDCVDKGDEVEEREYVWLANILDINSLGVKRPLTSLVNVESHIGDGDKGMYRLGEDPRLKL